MFVVNFVIDGKSFQSFEEYIDHMIVVMVCEEINNKLDKMYVIMKELKKYRISVMYWSLDITMENGRLLFEDIMEYCPIICKEFICEEFL